MIELIKRFEGCRLQAYDDGLGVWTIGYGTTKYADGTPVQQGDIIEQAYAEALLKDYVSAEVLPIINTLEGLAEPQKKALASLIYNWGGSFTKSKLYKAIQDRDLAEVYHQWDYGIKNWRECPGLVSRRAEELHTFLSTPECLAIFR